jgi:SNF2 family DNA or RNA helicase
MRHQVKALKKFLKMGGGALFAEMGTGKTKIAIDWAAATALRDNEPLRACVLCPKSVLGVWPDEIKKHDPWGEVPHIGVEWRIYSVDSAWRPYTYDEIGLWKPHILIVDESDTIKSPGARRSIGAYHISQRTKYNLVMSGTPIGKNRLDLFSQYRVVEPSIFGTKFGNFKKKYAIIRAYKVVSWMRQKTFKRRIRPWTFSILKSQCLDLPERRGHAWDPDGPNLVHVELSARTRKLYDTLAAESIVEFEDIEVMTPIILTRMLRLSQLASGYLVNNEISKQVGKEKRMQLEAQLDDMYHQDRKKVVIFCRFLKEVRDAAEAAHAAGYKVILLYGKTSKNAVYRTKVFARTSQPTCFIAQWQTGSRGLDLTCSSECIAYGLIYGLIPYGQGIDRQHRHGQVNKVTYYHYVASGTIDETVIQSLREKKKASKEILEDPTLLYGSRAGRGKH